MPTRELKYEWWELWERMPDSGESDEWALIGRFRTRAEAHKRADAWRSQEPCEKLKIVHVRRWALKKS